MKKSFTLIEVVISASIMVILIGAVVPIYDNYILKNRFEEAKITIQKIALAQERYKADHGEYYLAGSNVFNENNIAKDLNIDLTDSNNFVYFIQANATGTYYVITAMMRFDDTPCDNSGAICKQLGTKNRDQWVGAYNTSNGNHYLQFTYPSKFATDKVSFDYSNIATGG